MSGAAGRGDDPPVIRTILVAALLGAGVAAAPAAGATFCVAQPGCAGTPMPDVASALNAAAASSGSDRVEIGPGLYTAPSGGFVASAPEPVAVVGAGVGITILTAPAAPAGGNPGTVIDLSGAGETGVLIQDLTVRIPTGTGGTGLRLRGAAASRVVVEAPSGGAQQVGARMTQASILRDATVRLPAGTDSAAVVVRNSTGPLVLNSRLAADRGVDVVRGAATARLVRAEAGEAAFAATNGSLEVDGAVIRTSGAADGVGLGARSTALDPFGPAADASVIARHVTMLGSGGRGIGISAESFDGDAASVSVTSSVIAGAGTGIRRVASGSGRADVAVRFSDLATNAVSASGPGGQSVTDSFCAEPLFVDAVTGDLRPRAGSPLIDAGDPAGLAPAESATDIDGAPRVRNGRRDIGAFETGPPGSPTGPGRPGAAPSNRLGLKITADVTRIRLRCPRVSRVRCATVTTVRFRLRKPARVVTSLTRLGKKSALRSRSFRVKRARVVTLRVPVRAGQSWLRPGKYRFAILVLSDDRRVGKRSVVITVLPSA